MFIGLSEEQEQLRRELRAYYDKLLTPALREALAREHGIGPETKAVRQQMAKDGWLCFGWPKEYGGQGRGQVDHFIFFDESMRALAPGADAHHQHRRADDHALRHRRAEAASSCRRSRPARSSSASATRSRTRAPTWRRSRRARCATATTTS